MRQEIVRTNGHGYWGSQPPHYDMHSNAEVV